MALQPRGPLPGSIYWRRRLGIGLLLGLLLLLLLTRGCGGGGAAKQPSATPSPRATASAAPPASAATAAGPSATPAASALPSRSVAAAPAACGDAVLQVTAVADASTYKAGGSPRFTLTVTNVGRSACRRALGPDAVELRVFSGEDRIWSSDDCSKATGQGVQTLAAGQAQAMTLQWGGKRTKPNCQIGAIAAPGTYRVSARLGDIVRQGSVFDITG